MSLRPESSVSVDLNEFGELVFACDRPSPVIHRTPEELGLPRIVADIPVPKPISSFISHESPRVSVGLRRVDKPRMMETRITVCGSAHASKATHLALVKMAEAVQGRVIGGELVVMPAAAQMGAEPLEGFIAERRKEEKMSKQHMSPETELKIVADAKIMNIDQLTAKHGVKMWKIYEVLKKHGAKAVSKPLGPKNVHKPAKQPLRAVEIAPDRPGAASSLMAALAKVDASEDRLQLEMTVTEIATIVGRMDPSRRNAFLTAGLKAALLA